MARILVVDDDEAVLDVVCRNIKSDSRDIEWTRDPREAIERLLAEDWDLIITDFIMPEIDGFEIAKSAATKTPRTLCIMLTGYGTADTLLRSIETACFGFVDKPCDWDYLNLLISNAISSRQHLLRSTPRRQTDIERS